jgi:hypothetical protein
MAKKNNTKNQNLESRISQLEKRLTKLETLVEKKLNRRKRECIQLKQSLSLQTPVFFIADNDVVKDFYAHNLSCLD